METIEMIQEVQTIDVTKIKSDIKELSEKQLFFKNQRKTINLVGDRLISPGEASWKHKLNRDKLRLMYAAYGVIRGKTFKQIEKRYDLHNEHPLNEFKIQIDKIISSYKLKKTI
jgi:hypothetical protein